jgi:RNAse (barnase) inhibitor barstar
MSPFLLGTRPPWIHLLVLGRDAGERWLQSTGKQHRDAHVARIDGARATTFPAMFDQYASQFSLPEYFGRNGAALEECLSDLEWLPAAAYIVMVSQAHRLLENEGAEALAGHVASLLSIATDWSAARSGALRRPETPFHAVFQSDDRDFARRLESLVRQEGGQLSVDHAR